MKYRNLDWKQGQINPSGIRSIAFFIPKEHIEVFPLIQHENILKPEDGVCYQGDFVLKSGDLFWNTIYSTQGKGKVSYEVLGEKDCKMFTNKVTLSYPDINDEAKFFAKAGVNSSYIFVIPLPMNRYIVIGSEDYDIEVNTTGDSGDAAGSAKGTTIEITAPDVVPLPRYNGTIRFSSYKLCCLTGEKYSTSEELP